MDSEGVSIPLMMASKNAALRFQRQHTRDVTPHRHTDTPSRAAANTSFGTQRHICTFSLTHTHAHTHTHAPQLWPAQYTAGVQG